MKKLCLVIVFSFACLFLTACTPEEEEKEYVIALTGEGTVEVEAELQLSASVEGLKGAKFVWESSNEAVATVTNGKVIGVSVGEATITVRVEGNNEIPPVSKKISVTAKEIQYVISLSKNTVALEIGQEDVIEATVTPSVTLVWTSKNENIAMVVNGKITAVSAGSTTISVATNDAKASMTITVVVTAPKNLSPEGAQDKLTAKIEAYLAATGGKFILFTSDGTDELTLESQFNIVDGLFQGAKYVESGASNGAVYIKDGYAYMNSNDTTSKTILTAAENQRLVNQYGFRKVAEQVIAYCQDDNLFAVMSFKNEEDGVTTFDIDVAQYKGNIMDFAGVSSAQLIVKLVDDEVVEVELVVVKINTYIIKGSFLGTGTQSIVYPTDLSTYPEV
ncbi:MAG: Ig-like domain-containing protein [Bacilli bacterium]|jgi:hypothetical protein|nr:Ig-like domain-containing protein [Bacilli bacterium]MDD4056026.1 Ig-like domain-containing protein [Bacilli bacterium]MDY0208691.1 Ig-like domain-containing protein [Bacilli bacterium]